MIQRLLPELHYFTVLELMAYVKCVFYVNLSLCALDTLINVTYLVSSTTFSEPWEI